MQQSTLSIAQEDRIGPNSTLQNQRQIIRANAKDQAKLAILPFDISEQMYYNRGHTLYL
jgi:hypothetical protein